jgi:hypothetical protein
MKKNINLYYGILGFMFILSLVLGFKFFNVCDFLVNIIAGICVTSLGAIATILIINKIIEINNFNRYNNINSLLYLKMNSEISFAITHFGACLEPVIAFDIKTFVNTLSKFESDLGTFSDKTYLNNIINQIKQYMFQIDEFKNKIVNKKDYIINEVFIDAVIKIFNDSSLTNYKSIQDNVINKVLYFTNESEYIEDIIMLDGMISFYKTRNDYFDNFHSNIDKKEVFEHKKTNLVVILLILLHSLEILNYSYSKQVGQIVKFNKSFIP